MPSAVGSESRRYPRGESVEGCPGSGTTSDPLDFLPTLDGIIPAEPQRDYSPRMAGLATVLWAAPQPASGA